jgi:hypothetical protein
MWICPKYRGLILVLCIRVLRRFVGMLPSDQLQQFLVRALTGMGKRVQAKDVRDAELRDAAAKMRSLAGAETCS